MFSEAAGLRRRKLVLLHVFFWLLERAKINIDRTKLYPYGAANSASSFSVRHLTMWPASQNLGGGWGRLRDTQMWLCTSPTGEDTKEHKIKPRMYLECPFDPHRQGQASNHPRWWQPRLSLPLRREEGGTRSCRAPEATLICPSLSRVLCTSELGPLPLIALASLISLLPASRGIRVI